ncbi:hypothetical protein B5807_11804 [Epicoccum nigrum]|uniref:Uncharacterized protein n=1 Tax=Epicoccum nigrum TaxID=105696 RepID=A0A1Y2LIL2_EPING|nr:hypothetical protein B5807_11804 [Epicoccum nigrum]
MESTVEDNGGSLHPRHLITERNQDESLLFRLPAELRNKIYAHVSEHITAECWYYDKEFHSKIRFKHDNSGLLLACQQLLYEASPYINSHQHLTWYGLFETLNETS